MRRADAFIEAERAIELIWIRDQKKLETILRGLFAGETTPADSGRQLLKLKKRALERGGISFSFMGAA